MKITYKILVNPHTLNAFVNEIQIHDEGVHGVRLENRTIDNDELSTWTKGEFLERMSKWGYDGAAHYYLEHNSIAFGSELSSSNHH